MIGKLVLVCPIGQLDITECDIMDRESDSELDEMLDSDYYPSSNESQSELNPVTTFKIGTIYKITSTGTDKIYIGSTVNPAKRWALHKSQYKKGTLDCMSKLILQHGNYTFTKLTQCKFTHIEQLRALEYKIMKLYKDKIVNIGGTKDSRSPEYIKASNAKLNAKWNATNNARWNPITSKATYKCECCNQEMKNTYKYTHNKTAKHLKNLKPT